MRGHARLGGLLGLHHLGGQSTEVADTVPIVLGPRTDRFQRFAVVARGAAGAPDGAAWAGYRRGVDR